MQNWFKLITNRSGLAFFNSGAFNAFTFRKGREIILPMASWSERTLPWYSTVSKARFYHEPWEGVKRLFWCHSNSRPGQDCPMQITWIPTNTQIRFQHRHSIRGWRWSRDFSIPQVNQNDSFALRTPFLSSKVSWSTRCKEYNSLLKRHAVKI